MPKISTSTKISVVIHSREFSKSINTGRLACCCLENSEVLLLGHPGNTKKSAVPSIINGYQPIVLFPDGIPLDSYLQKNHEKKYHLIVPDGSWSQGRKMAAQLVSLLHKESTNSLKAVRVSLPLFENNPYAAIRSSKSGGASTLGAIAKAMGLLEGVQVEKKLKEFLEIFIDSVKRSRQ
jgi:DTW domain-containing protein